MTVKSEICAKCTKIDFSHVEQLVVYDSEAHNAASGTIKNILLIPKCTDFVITSNNDKWIDEKRKARRNKSIESFICQYKNYTLCLCIVHLISNRDFESVEIYIG